MVHNEHAQYRKSFCNVNQKEQNKLLYVNCVKEWQSSKGAKAENLL